MSSDRNELPPRLDPFELAARDDPYRVYAKLRAAGPVLRGGPGVWVVPRYREIAALLREPRLGQFQFQLPSGAAQSSPAFESESVAGGPASQLMRRFVVASNGAEHARVRRALAQAFPIDRFQALRELVASAVSRLLARACARGKLEAIADLACPLPLAVIGHVLGISPDDRERVGRQVLTLSKLFSPVIAETDRAAADAAVMELQEYFGTLFDDRIADPGEDMLSAFAAAFKAGVLSREECVDNGIFMAFAGIETSMTLIATGCAALSQNPEQMARLRAMPSLAGRAVEEFLRFDAPTQITARIALDPVEIAGRTLPAGRVVLLLLGSANRDESVFSEPDVLDIAREPNPHLSFGAGAHYCLGAGLARLEGEILFRALAERTTFLEPDGQIVREANVTPRIYSRIPLGIG